MATTARSKALKHLSGKELKGYAGKKDTLESMREVLHTRKGYYKEDVAKGGKFYKKD
jgi:hypothetical protein